MTGRWRRWARVGVLVIAGIAALPLAAIVALRWIDPPTSAFMLRHRFAGEPSSGGAGGSRPTVDYRWTDLDDIAPVIALAVVAAEDQLFPRHHGFDVVSIEKAIDERQRRRRVRGASTISQQVAKNLFLWPGRSWVRKGLEAYLTAMLELAWPKRRILEVYLNVAELGTGIYGVGAAADVYFGKPPSALTRREAALLASALPNPTRRPASRPSPWMQERAGWIEGQIDQLGGMAHLAGVLTSEQGVNRPPG